MTKVKIPQNAKHRCYSRYTLGQDEAIRELIIIERKDISFPTNQVSPDVYGAIEVFISDDGEVDFYFVLIRDDDQIFCPEFVLSEDFTRHVNAELRNAVYCKPMREAFEISGDIDTLMEAHLNGIWLARCLAEKFKFTADISFNGRSTMTNEGIVELTMTRPWSGQEKHFTAHFNPDGAGGNKYIGPDSLEGPLYFGKAA